MSEENETGDKQHEPTQRKLDEARKKGEIARSQDMLTAAGYAGFLACWLVFGANSIDNSASALAGLLHRAAEMGPMTLGSDLSSGSALAPLTGLFGDVVLALVPWFVLPGLMAAILLASTRGLALSGSKLAPKLSRLSPIAGLRNKFGRAGLFEFTKSTVKLVIYGLILFLALWTRMPEILASLALTPGQVMEVLTGTGIDLVWMVAGVALGMGLIDALWQKSEHIRRNRMSHKELRDEMKESEGDPHLKQNRRERGVALALNQMMAAVPKADVVIVNPTHYAVALKWDRQRNSAPVCVAKGVDEIALRIRAVALEYGVPVRSDPATARALWAEVDIGTPIARDHYRAVAAAIRFADKLRTRRRR